MSAMREKQAPRYSSSVFEMRDNSLAMMENVSEYLKDAIIY